LPFGAERLQECSGMDANDKTSLSFGALAGLCLLLAVLIMLGQERIAAWIFG
jgi:hypothetical protein